jgi:FKBP-type peptidyl-prolyl cis-trans isomerase 2
MAHPRSGDTARVHYTGRLSDGRIFDSSRERGPIEVTVGSGKVIRGFEQAVTEMQPGEERTVTIPAAQAYGPRRDELMVAVDREEFPEHIEPTVGQKLQVQNDRGQTTVVRIAEVSKERVLLDANHPLAGEDLTFDLELVEIKSGS